MPKIIHQREKCIRCGACAIACSDFFKMNKKDNLADLKKSKKVKNNFELTIESKDIDCAKKAANTCPVKVIKIQ